MADTNPPGPLTYIGQVAVPYILKTFPPTAAFNKFKVPTIWVDYLNMNAYILVSVDLGTAEWLQIGSFPGTLATITTPDATVVTPAAGNINFLNGTGMNITGSGSNITFNSTVSSSITFVEDSGSAAPAGGNLNILGTLSQGLTTSGAGSTVTLSNQNASEVQKGVVLLASNAETVAGTDTSKAVTPADLTAKLGTQTVHGVALGATTTSPLSYTGAGTTGQAFISGGPAVDPDWGVLGTIGGGTGNNTYNNGELLIGNSVGNILTKNTLTSSDGSVTITNGNGTIDLKAAPVIGLTQVVSSSTSSVVNCGPIIPFDDTIPQNTEGTQVLTVTITPTDVNNIIYILFEGWGYGSNTAAGGAIAALFQDSTANALATTLNSTYGPNVWGMVGLTHYMVAGTTSATTFKIRVGMSAMGNFLLNSDNAGNRKFGGTSSTRLTVWEYKV